MSTAGDVGRVWLDVPYSEKEEAKKLGARWDPGARRWYAPRVDMPGLDRWAALPDVPELLPGEDRSFGEGLFVDLVPESCWFTNVRSCVSKRDWERIRRMVVGRAGARCEVCGAGEDRYRRPRERWLDVHERWAYDSKRRVQSLRRLICLCTDCHTTTHYGHAQVNGLAGEAFAHLCAVTGMAREEAEHHVAAAWKWWEYRSMFEWTLDLGMLTDAGVTVVRPPTASERAAEAAAQTAVVRGNGLDPEDADAVVAEAVELVRMMRGSGLPVEDTSEVRVRVRGREVTVDPRGL